jgi:predicted Zn-dependent protease
MGQVVAIFARLEGAEEVRFCEAAPGRRALDELTGRLSQAAASPYQFRISVMDLDVPNAFALPGGRIVVFRGLIDFAESADEVAGVLAHEMGHVTYRHGTEGIVKSLGLAFFFGVMLGDLGSGAIGLAGETLVSTAYSRDAETEADGAALELLGRAGLRAEGVAEFFARLQETYGDMPAALALLSTHPTNESRAQRFTGATGAAALSEGDWQALKAICGE